MGAVPVRTGQDRDRPANRDRNIQSGAATDERIANAAHRVGSVSVAVGVAPRVIRWSCDRHFQFQLLIIRTDIFVADGPVDAHAVAGMNFKIGGDAAVA